MGQDVDLTPLGIRVPIVIRNPSPAKLYEEALKHEKGTAIADSGAMIALSGSKTGRSPKDKRLVEHPDSADDIWWGDINIPLSLESFETNKERAVDHLNELERLFVIDGFAGADPEHQIKVRVICERAYHALFMHNMLIRPTADELETYGEPDFLIYNAGRFPANSHTTGVSSKTSVDLCFEQNEFVILGTQYAGEMKKGVFTLMHYLMPRKGHLSMHCSATEGESGDVSLFFGLSGTGKTTLSADPHRKLIGDDEHVWTDRGVFNIEGGCYAKVINLSAEQEPEIYQAIRFGTVLENVTFDDRTRHVDYTDDSITTNTRASYPIDYIPGAKIPSVAGHPSNVIFLTCDAFGVLPPVSRLTPAEAMYHFIAGYTAKIPGTEVGLEEPKATFSPCFGAPFLVWPPQKYADLLARQLREHEADTWLINTGWTGGPFGKGRRIDLAQTRAIIDAIHDGSLVEANYSDDPAFNLSVPDHCPGVPDDILHPRRTWDDPSAYDQQAEKLVALFEEHFRPFANVAPEEVREAAPHG
ncbi:MAG: phosphoenolpyruvate carboxykinase (ATP) [Phycisphaeraceae bacterium]|nr:phosphoenolpyruvate carboxykinase (ATP) [Phycisphaeraceae bacterium]